MPESIKNSVQKNNIEHNGHLHAVKDMEAVSPEVVKLTKEIERLEEQKKIAGGIGGGTPDIDRDIEKLMQERRQIAEGTAHENEAKIDEIQEKIANLEDQQKISKMIGGKDPLIERDLRELNKELKKLGWTEEAPEKAKNKKPAEYNPQIEVVHSSFVKEKESVKKEKKVSAPKTRKEELGGIVSKRMSEINKKDAEKYPGSTPEEVKAKKQEVVDKRIEEIKAGIMSSETTVNVSGSNLSVEAKRNIEARKLLDQVKSDYEDAVKKYLQSKKNRSFFSKIWGGGETAQLKKRAQAIGSMYHKAILQFGSIIYFDKENELKNMKKDGTLAENDFEKTLDAYKKKEIKNIIEKETTEMHKIEKMMNNG